MGQLGKTIAAAGEAMVWYMNKSVDAIDPSVFAVKPQGADGEIDTNHPAFIVGHLATYPAWLLGMMGAEPGPAAMPATYGPLFSAKAECVSDPDGTRYPAKDELVKAFNEAHGRLFSVLREVDDDTLAKPNSSEGMRDMFPTIGMLADFMLGMHAGTHLGQLSAWRRCMGLGKVF